MKKQPAKYAHLFTKEGGKKISKKQARKVLHDIMAEYLFMYSGVTPEILEAIKADAKARGLKDAWLDPQDN